MKYLITVFVLLTATITFAGGHIEGCGGYPPDGTIWTFKIRTDERDQWDSSKSEHPRLAPKKAKDLATAFMKRVPLGDKMIAWQLSEITLKRMHHKPEHWIYMVHFDAVPDPKLGPWNGPVPWFEVFVRMNGTIPEPKILQQKKK